MDLNKDYWALADYEKHLNTIQGAIRTLVVNWILGFGTALAILMRGNVTSLLMPPAQTCIVVCFLASAGIFLFWIIDQKVYQRLLGGVFLAGLRIEKQDPRFPPMRLLMLERFNGQGASTWLKWFYGAPPVFFFHRCSLDDVQSVARSNRAGKVLFAPIFYGKYNCICDVDLFVQYRVFK